MHIHTRTHRWQIYTYYTFITTASHRHFNWQTYRNPASQITLDNLNMDKKKKIHPKKSILCYLPDLKKQGVNRDSGDWHFASCCSPFKRQMQFKLPFLASWPLGSVLLPLKRKRLFSRSLPVSCSSPSLSTACRENKQERNTRDCSYSINRSHCTSSLVTFRLLADTQPLPPLSYRRFHCITLICSNKKEKNKKKHLPKFIFSQCQKDTILHRPSNSHKSVPPMKIQWEVPALLLSARWTLVFFPWLNIYPLCDIGTSKT